MYTQILKVQCHYCDLELLVTTSVTLYSCGLLSPPPHVTVFTVGNANCCQAQ